MTKNDEVYSAEIENLAHSALAKALMYMQEDRADPTDGDLAREFMLGHKQILVAFQKFIVDLDRVHQLLVHVTDMAPANQTKLLTMLELGELDL